MSNIIIWLKSSQKETFAPSYHKSASYNQLAQALAARNDLFFAYDAASYRGDDIFEPAYKYKDGEISTACARVTADAIYNLGNIPREDFKTLRAGITNTPVFKKFCASKWDMYQFLPDFFPFTIPVMTEAEFFSAVERMPSDMVVFKPNAGTNGVGVRIFKKSETLSHGHDRNSLLNCEMRADIARGALVQEFIDTENGIPSICDSYHDLRLVTINQTIALTHVRIPEQGSLIANYQRGAEIRELSAHILPKEAISFYEAVHEKIAARFPMPMYSMDIGLGPSGPRLFELNGHTAFPWPDFECRNSFIENLVAHIESVSAPRR